MRIVIDIDEDYYEIIKHEVKVNHNDFKPYDIIANGTPLPKGHGDLIDACEEMRFMQSCDYDTYEDYLIAFDMLENAPIVIEADKGETE